MQGRYERLNADPVVRVGADVRFAALLSGNLVFPMQVDLPVGLHPTHHLTILVNTGARGRPSGFSETYNEDHSLYLREAFAMVHEAPYQA